MDVKKQSFKKSFQKQIETLKNHIKNKTKIYNHSTGGNGEQTHEEEHIMLITTLEQLRGNDQRQKQSEILRTGRCRIELCLTPNGRTSSRGFSSQ